MRTLDAICTSEWDPLAAKNMIGTTGEMGMVSEDQRSATGLFNFLIDGYIVVLWENALIFRNPSLKYLQVMGHQIGNLLSDGSGKI